jgi:hypothetical protein
MGNFLLGGQVDPLPSSNSVTCPRFHMAVAMNALIDVANSPWKSFQNRLENHVKPGEYWVKRGETW